MKTPAQAAAPAAAAPAAATEATSAAAAPAAPTQETIDAAIRADRERMSAIKALPEAAKLPKMADHLATAGYSVDEAKAALEAGVADLPTAPAAAAPGATGGEAVDTTNHLANAMDQSKHPNVGEGEGGQQQAGAEKTDSELAAGILADASAATGRVFERAAK